MDVWAVNLAAAYGVWDLYRALQLIHVLAAAVWIGGHVVVLRCAWESWRRGDPSLLLELERRYERLGMASLAVAVAAGVGMGLLMLPPGLWPGYWPLAGKAAALLATVALALDARLRVIPKLKAGGGGMLDLLLHVAAVTALSFALALFGWAIRVGL